MDFKGFRNTWSRNQTGYLGLQNAEEHCIQGRSRLMHARLSFKISQKFDHLTYKCVWGLIKQILHGLLSGKHGIYFPSILATGLSPLSFRLRGNRPVASTSGK